MFSIITQSLSTSLRYHSELVYYLERLFFFLLIRKRKYLTHLSKVTFVELVPSTDNLLPCDVFDLLALMLQERKAGQKTPSVTAVCKNS